MSKPNQPIAQNPARAGDPNVQGAKHHAFDDDALHVPKGVSRGTFIFLVGLMIFLLVIWLVPGAMFGIASGTRNPVMVRFTLPNGGKVEWRSTDMLEEQRAIMDAFSVDFFLAMTLGVDASKPAPEDLTRLLVLDRIARDAGIEITDADLAGHLRETLDFQRATPEDFKNSVRMRSLDQVTVENTIRQLLRVSRFQQLVGFAGAVPDPKKIEEQWHQENVEFAFDYVTLAVDGLKEEARKSLPDDAGLKAWFDKLDEGEQAEFKSAERRKAELALFRDAETTPATELLAAYPEVLAEGAQPTAPEEQAQQYYNRVSWRRFAKPKPEGDDASMPGGFFSFEEVKPQCLAEAPVFFALQRWVEDLNARRTNGEAIDLAAEAQKLGLDHQAFPEALARDAFAAADAAGDESIADAIFATPPDGSFHPAPLALPSGLVIVRATERTEPEMPPFETLRERVVEKWLAPKAEELAQQRLADLRRGFERFEPAPPADAPPRDPKQDHHRASAEAFATAAQAAGLAVKSRDYLNKAGPQPKNPLADDEERRALFTQANQWGLYNLETDEVAAPALNPEKTQAYLVRLAGKRDVPLANMSPTQYDRYKQMARSRAMGEIGRKLDVDYLKRNFGLWLYSESPEAQAAKKSP